MERIRLETARSFLEKAGAPVAAEQLLLEECLGRVLAEDVRAAVSHPPFARSAMDGYAVRSSDVMDASPEKPVLLKVTGCYFAGVPAEKSLGEWEAIRIMTGGMIPAGADCVIRQEDTDFGKNQVQIRAAGYPGQNCAGAGEDFNAGELLAKAGYRVDASLMAAAAAGGIESFRVRRPVRAAVITTGDELQPVGSGLKKGKIYNSSQVYLCARLKQLGCEVQSFSCQDDLDALCTSVSQATLEADVILTTGGVSVGERDLLPAVMEKLGAEVVFHGIDVKPGMPAMFSVLGRVPVLSLSGNPYAAFSVFELLFPLLLKSLNGAADSGLRQCRALLSENFEENRRTRRIVRGYCNGNTFFASRRQKNAQVSGGIGCNSLAEIPAGDGGLEKETEVNVWFLPGLF